MTAHPKIIVGKGEVLKASW